MNELNIYQFHRFLYSRKIALDTLNQYIGCEYDYSYLLDSFGIGEMFNKIIEESFLEVATKHYIISYNYKRRTIKEYENQLWGNSTRILFYEILYKKFTLLQKESQNHFLEESGYINTQNNDIL